MADHTPGPWTVKLSEHRHRKGSSACLERCGHGAVPIRIEQDSPEGAIRSGSPNELELHVLLIPDQVEDVMAADGTHVVCTGHDYNDGGHVSPADARLIAAAPELLALAEKLDRWGYTITAENAAEIVDDARAALAKAGGR